MEDSRSGMSWLGVLFFVVILLVLIGGGIGNGLGFGNRNGCNFEGGCNRVSNCQVEKSEIINSAKTQYLVEQQSSDTRTAIRDSRDAVMGQASRIYEAQQSEKIFDLKMENQALKGQIYSDAKFNALEKQISDCCCGINQRFASIECNMLTKPNLSGIASTCNGQIVPAILRGCNTCNGNNNI